GNVFADLVFARDLREQIAILLAAGFKLPEAGLAFIFDFFGRRPAGLQFFDFLEDPLDERIDALRIAAEPDRDLVLLERDFASIAPDIDTVRAAEFLAKRLEEPGLQNVCHCAQRDTVSRVIL